MILSVENLTINFEKNKGVQQAIHGLSFSLSEGEILGVVGESGCGKSLTNYALMGLLPRNARIHADKFEFKGMDLLSLSPKGWRKLRGTRIAMIFQNPMSALNPCYTIGMQLLESLRVYQPKLRKKEGIKQALELLNEMGITNAEYRLNCYPHELSGGIAQRVMIAMALACRPDILIADEPTTALDVTIQMQILVLLKSLCKKMNTAMILVSHDIAVVRAMADRIQVMYSGEIVEQGPSKQLVDHPRHPYTKGLIESIPIADPKQSRSRLNAISGVVPSILQTIDGCRFSERCAYHHNMCRTKPVLSERLKKIYVRCHLEEN